MAVKDYKNLKQSLFKGFIEAMIIVGIWFSIIILGILIIPSPNWILMVVAWGLALIIDSLFIKNRISIQIK